MKSSYNALGEYIQLVDERNTALENLPLMGLSISKEFIPSVANIIGTDLRNYKVVRKKQFACSLMQVSRDGKIPIAMLSQEKVIMSPAYPIFEVINSQKLDPEYLMMWFSRSEFDRQAAYYAVGGVRGNLPWEDFCEITLPVPHIDKQREILKEYKTVQNRINLNQQIIQKLEETAQAVYKQWFVEFEFPDENGKPYKSNGGKMVWNEELGKEIPLGWEVGNFKHDLSFKTGKLDSNAAIGDGKYPFFTCSEEVFKVNSFSFDQEAILLGGNNATGKFPLKYFKGKFDAYQRTYVINTNNNQISNKQIYFRIKGLLDEMRESSVGTTTKFLTMQIFNVIPILVPVYEIAITFEKHIQKIFTVKDLYLNENQKLEELKELLLSKLVTVEG
jgi:type I restriction enzyme S subunit